MFVELISKNNGCFNLFNSMEELETSYIRVVYFDDEYYFSVKCKEDLCLHREEIHLYINSEEVRVDKPIKTDVQSYIIIPEKKNMFDMIYGVTDVVLEINNNVFFSNKLAVAYKNDEKYNKNVDSLKRMIDDIISQEYSFFNVGNCIERKDEVVNKHFNCENANELILLNQIIEEYNKNYANFYTNPYSKLIDSYVVEKTDKLTAIDSKTLQYIVENPQYLSFSNVPTGIFYNGMPVAPIKTLVKNVIKDTNIYENQQILGFILYLLNYVNNKIYELDKNYNKQEKYSYSKIKANYILSLELINRYSEEIYTRYLNELIRIKKNLLSLKLKYLKCFSIDTIPIKNIPKLTPIFLEIFHYNKIFLMIKKWFSHGIFQTPNKNIEFNMQSADKIYELYSMINLYECICEAGYKEITRKKYQYIDEKKDYYFSNTKKENTFIFKKNDETIYLYYQPVIKSEYKQEASNGIDLFRVDTRNRFYNPDFVIKKIKGDLVKYSIIDSKWRDFSSLWRYENGLKEIIYKYFCSITDTKHFKAVDYLWLLSGKEKNEEIRYFRNSPFCESNFDFKTQIGVVALNPENYKNKFNQIVNLMIN